MTITAALNELVARLGSEAAVAQRLHVAQSQVYRWRHGRTYPSGRSPTLKRIAELVGVAMHDLSPSEGRWPTVRERAHVLAKALSTTRKRALEAENGFARGSLG